jgi:signal transduction histidine kinase
VKRLADWSVFWSIFGAVSIRTKVMGIAALCILIATLALAWHNYTGMSAALSNQLQKRAVSIASNLAAQGSDLILTDDKFGLYILASNTLASDGDVAYVLMFDAENNLLAHTFDQGIPVELLEINQLGVQETYKVQKLKTELGIIRDVAVPVLGGQAGFVRVGMSEAIIKTQVNQLIIEDFIWLAIVLVIGLYTAYGMTVILTKPISQLAQAARAVGTDKFTWKTPLWARDEIGSLGATFIEVSAELKRREEMHQQLLGKVISAQEEERKRVARELHDEVGQALTVIMMDLARTRDMLPNDATEAVKRVSRSRSVAEQTLSDLRKLINELRPEVLDQLGLVAALRSYIKTRLQTENTEVRTNFPNLRERLSPELETTLFRVIQEAITNIIRHSHATLVDIKIEVDHSTATASIEDNGIGFDADRALADITSIGLRGIRERVAIVGGELNIEAKSGYGTRLEIRLPLNGT